jgi:HTH-type transcriptional regulator/antitoxin HipB
MSVPHDTIAALAALLRSSRRARGLTVVALAEEAGVSPRLVSEFERGKRPHVSLETALRLLHLAGAVLPFASRTEPTDEASARAERAARRRATWSGTHSTLTAQAPPAPPSAALARVIGVARASQLVSGLQAAHRRSPSPESSPRGSARPR